MGVQRVWDRVVGGHWLREYQNSGLLWIGRSIMIKSKVFKLVILLGVLGSLFFLSKVLPLGTWLTDFLSWIDGFGVWKYVAYCVAYLVLTVVLVPGSFLTLGAGILFGLWVGTLMSIIGSVSGATASFLVGRVGGRRFVEKLAEGNEKFAAIDRAVEKRGFRIVFLTRLSPLFPFVLLNYLFSLTKVRLWSYVGASTVGMLPGTFMYVYFGKVIGDLTKLASGEGMERGAAYYAMMGLGLAATVVVTVYVTRIAKRAMNEYAPGTPESSFLESLAPGTPESLGTPGSSDDTDEDKYVEGCGDVATEG